MDILIDSQVVIWLAENNPNLGPSSNHLIHNTVNRIFISYFSLLELIMKKGAGKLVFELTAIDDLENNGVTVVYPDRALLKEYKVFKQDNKDPFDNAIITHAILNKATLLAADRKILATKAPGLKLMDARL